MTGYTKHIGEYYGEREIEITPALVEHYAASVQDANPWYFGDSPFGGPVAPVLVLHSEVYRSVDWYLSIFGNLHARQEFELFAPMMVGDTVLARREIVDRYIKRDREYVVMETGIYGRDGRMYQRGRTHQSFLLDAKPDGRVVVDKEREKRSDRRFEVESAAIEEFEGPAKAINIEMCKLFSPGKSYHNAAEEARKLGFPDIVVQGMMSLCFISEMMTERFGPGWYCGGRMDTRLVNVLWGGDTATARGAITVQGPLREEARVWCEKADGTGFVVGTASAAVSA
jgi:hypothetical protein